MRPIILVNLLQIISLFAPAQKMNDLTARPLRSDSTDLYVHLIDVEQTSKVNVCPSCQYHWIKGGKVQTTKGGYEGKLLHGLYTEFYREGNLLQKGTFRKGLKSGEWRTWHRNGEMASRSNYRYGKLNGEFLEYATDGVLVSKRQYRKGELHGRTYTYDDSTTIVEKYRNGSLRKSSEKTLKNKNPGSHSFFIKKPRKKKSETSKQEDSQVIKHEEKGDAEDENLENPDSGDNPEIENSENKMKKEKTVSKTYKKKSSKSKKPSKK